MKTLIAGSIRPALHNLGIRAAELYYQLPADTLTEQTLLRGEGQLSATGALCINTGKFTGRSPQDKFIVKDHLTLAQVDWNKFNIAISLERFRNLRQKMVAYLSARPAVWLRDCYACASAANQLSVRVVNEDPASNLFAHNMFIRPSGADLHGFSPDWLVLHAPGFEADPLTDGTRKPNFAIISFADKTILIGGTGYTGEIKKGIFTVLNFLMPMRVVLGLHCAANIGPAGDTALFFGLSGTGKTTLSTSPGRRLIGDDEHGWDEDGVFNFEGGCYAKCYNLSPGGEPEIFGAVREGAMLENVTFLEGGNEVDFKSMAITENTRVSYPIHFIPGAVSPSVGGHPKNIFFLTCDANGVLPPVSRLSREQAVYHFLSGYTARVAGTESDVKEPKSTFSACFGAPFMPLKPGKYADMLSQRLKKGNIQVWLINTGWGGGAYGKGSRISLACTRLLVSTALAGGLRKVGYGKLPVFGLEFPLSCPGVPDGLLNPRDAWDNQDEYDNRLKQLGASFAANFQQFIGQVDGDVLRLHYETRKAAEG